MGLIITTSRVREDELMASTCARVFSPPVLEREVVVMASSQPQSAGIMEPPNSGHIGRLQVCGVQLNLKIVDIVDILVTSL